MPVRRRKAKRVDVGGYEVWEEFLRTGHDTFADLRWAKITAGLEKPPRELVEEAWRRHGDRLTVEHGPDTWGAGEFG